MSKNIFYKHPFTRLDINGWITGLLLQLWAFPRMEEDWKAARGMRRVARG
jgi:hypothetical protein